VHSNRLEDAVKAFDEASKLRLKDASIWYMKAIVLDKLGNNELAHIAFDEALKNKPDLASAYNTRGIALGNLGYHEEALEAFEEALRYASNYASAWYNKGCALSDLGRNEEAVIDFDNAINYDPDNASAFNNKGVAFLDLGRNKEALTAFNEALRCSPDHVSSWHNRGKVLSELGREDEANESFEKASKYDIKSVTIVFEDKFELYKISKIILIQDGGFSLAIPYCNEKNGCIFMAHIDESLHYFVITPQQMIQKFTLDRNAKMTVHSSGFIHFSGQGITSGIDRTTGKIKGVGLFSSPLDRPIDNRPSLSAKVWGLSSGYSKFKMDDKNSLIFHETDYDYRFASIENYNSYLIEIFVFPSYMRKQVKEDSDGFYLYNQFFEYREKPGAIYKLRVIFLKNISSFLGILVTRSYIQNENIPHGFQFRTLAGPQRYIKGKLMRLTAFAVYPSHPSWVGLPSLRHDNMNDSSVN